VPLPEAELGLEHLRRELEAKRTWLSLCLGALGALAAAVITGLCGLTQWLTPLGLLLAPLAVAYFSRTLAHVRALDTAALPSVEGHLARSTMGGWHFVTDDGARYALYPPRASVGWQRGGPALAKLDRRTRAALSWASLAVDAERDAALRQAELDAFFGTNAADRASFAEGRLSPRMRVRAALEAVAWTTPAAVLVVAIVGVVPRDAIAMLFLLGLYPILALFLALPRAQLAWQGRCLDAEGTAWPHSSPAGRGEVHCLSVSALTLRVGRSAACVVQPHQRVRAYFDPHGLFDLPTNRRVLAVEHLTPAPEGLGTGYEPGPIQSAWLAADARHAIEDFRRQLH
jgi:hypothetical protein